MRIETGAKVEGAEASDSGVTVSFNGESDEFDYLVIAAGRAPDVEGLGLEEAGIERDERGLIKVDGHLRTTSRACGRSATWSPAPRSPTRHPTRASSPSRTPSGMDVHPIDYAYVPAVTFCHPQVASFGLTREGGEARPATTWSSARSRWARSARPPSTATAAAWSRSWATSSTARCWAASIVSVKAADLIQELVNARELEGGYPEVARIIHPHPAFAEAVMEAARATDGWLIHG